MKTPLVSVIVPNYNHAPFLRQRLDSIFNQTFQDFEVIILDDCSTDNSKEIIEEYRNKPQVSHIVYNETNTGSPFKQWAKGFELAQGEYIWIAESDDWAELDFLKEQSTILNNDKTLTLTYSNSYDEIKNKQTKIHIKSTTSKKFNSHDMLHNHMCYGCAIYNASSVLFRKACILNIPKNYQEFTSSGDYLFWTYAIETGNVFFNHRILNHFRIHQNSTSKINGINGRVFIENHHIFKYLNKKGYLTFFKKQVIVLSYLKEIQQALSTSSYYSNLKEAQKLWSKEIFSESISKFFVLLITFFWKQTHHQ